jgi:hypothetical protein
VAQLGHHTREQLVSEDFRIYENSIAVEDYKGHDPSNARCGFIRRQDILIALS